MKIIRNAKMAIYSYSHRWANCFLSILTIPTIGAKNIKDTPAINRERPICIWDAPNFLCMKGAIIDSTKAHPAAAMKISMYGIHMDGL